jgi:hypothetical protein
MYDKSFPYSLNCHVEGTPSRGRQTTTWMTNVRQDLEEQNLDMRAALDTIRDRKKWSDLVA